MFSIINLQNSKGFLFLFLFIYFVGWRGFTFNILIKFEISLKFTTPFLDNVFFFLLEIKINKKKIPYKGLDSKMSHKPNKGKGQF